MIAEIFGGSGESRKLSPVTTFFGAGGKKFNDLRFEEAKGIKHAFDTIHCIALPSTKSYTVEWASEEAEE